MGRNDSENQNQAKETKMDLNTLTFGVEIETTAPATLATTDGLQVGRYHRGTQVPYLPTGWTAENDGSIRTPANHMPCEIVSPVLSGAEGLAQVLETLEAKGHRVNASCGVHVHVGFSRTTPAATLARLISIVAYAENGLYAITGTKARERGNYTKSVRQHGKADTAKARIERDRYHALNLTNLANASRPSTVEFRVFSGSLNPVKVVGWILVCLGLVQRAHEGKRAPTWAPKPLKGGWACAGQGASEAERLMGYLAWGEGYAKTHGGKTYGWLEAGIPQDAVKAEFRRLARKYDESTAA